MISTNFYKINIFIPRNRYTFLEINVLHANRYLYNLNQVYISGKTTTSSKIRTSSKLLFWSLETGIHFWSSTYFIKLDIFITWNRYTILEINVLHQHWYLHNLNQVYIPGKKRLHQNWYFYNLKQVYISRNQRTSSKLIFLSRETGIHFWNSTYIIKIDIFITWNVYTILEINIRHQNWYF